MDEMSQAGEVNDLLRAQGEARLLKKILDGYYKADETKRRVESRNGSAGKGPSIPAIT